MSLLVKTGIRIHINKPFRLFRRDYFGIVEKQNKNELIVRLNKSIRIKSTKGNLILLKPLKNEAFKSLIQHYPVKITGSVIKDSDNPKTKFFGIVILD